MGTIQGKELAPRQRAKMKIKVSPASDIVRRCRDVKKPDDLKEIVDEIVDSILDKEKISPQQAQLTIAQLVTPEVYRALFGAAEELVNISNKRTNLDQMTAPIYELWAVIERLYPDQKNREGQIVRESHIKHLHRETSRPYR